MASRSINKVMLMGNLTRDPELKYTPNKTAVCSFGLATNRSWTTADGQIREEAQYHRIVAWQKLAELCEKLLEKGKKIYVEGRITYRDYTTKDGQKKTAAEIVMEDFILLENSKKRNDAYESSESPSDQPEQDLNQFSDADYHQDQHNQDTDSSIQPKDLSF